MLVCRPQVIQTQGRSFGEHSCTALARPLLRGAKSSSSALVLTSLLALVLLPYDYKIITGLEPAKACSRPVIISVIMISCMRTSAHTYYSELVVIPHTIRMRCRGRCILCGACERHAQLTHSTLHACTRFSMVARQQQALSGHCSNHRARAPP